MGPRDRDGRPEIMGSVQDVTERRLSEEALGKVRSELARMTRVMEPGGLDRLDRATKSTSPCRASLPTPATCLRMLSTDPP